MCFSIYHGTRLDRLNCRSLDQDGKDLRFAATLTIHVGQAWCTPLRLLPAAATYHCSCIQTERCDCSYFAGVGPVELTNNRLVLGPPAAAKNIENRIESKQSINRSNPIAAPES